MQATLENFRTLFPEFAAESDSRVEFALELAREQFCGSENGVLYLAAHTLCLWKSEGTGSETGSTETQGSGFATRQRVGDLEVQYSAPDKTSDADFMRTPYGRQFLNLKNALAKKLSVRVL